MNITVYLPKFIPDVELDKVLTKEFLNQKPLTPFDELSIEFLSGLSNKILGSKILKGFTELAALAYWLRKSNIVSIINSFKKSELIPDKPGKISENDIIVPRGIAFHIAPSNVDSIFLYSWALSLLIGNLNIVRITQNTNEQLEALLSVIREMFSGERWNQIAQRNIVITYPREDEINRFISHHSDVRVLWGGDETINSFRVLPAKPTTKDISFADKFSYSIINSSVFNISNEEKKSSLAKQFYNDAYWFDQMACASPRFVLFAGDNSACEKASKQFWQRLEDELIRRSKADSIDMAMEKLVYLFESISKSEKALPAGLPEQFKPTVLRVDKVEIGKFRESCGGGFFFECFLGNLDELIPLVSRKDQTLTYFGFTYEELSNFVLEVNGAGIDRIVPIGQALNFSPSWDGYSLLNELSKRVHID